VVPWPPAPVREAFPAGSIPASWIVGGFYAACFVLLVCLIVRHRRSMWRRAQVWLLRWLQWGIALGGGALAVFIVVRWPVFIAIAAIPLFRGSQFVVSEIEDAIYEIEAAEEQFIKPD
jgi:hypothetical protein